MDAQKLTEDFKGPLTPAHTLPAQILVTTSNECKRERSPSFVLMRRIQNVWSGSI